MKQSTQWIVTGIFTLVLIIGVNAWDAFKENVLIPQQREDSYNEAVSKSESNPEKAAKIFENNIPDFNNPNSHAAGYLDRFELMIYAHMLYYISVGNCYDAISEGNRIDYEYT